VDSQALPQGHFRFSFPLQKSTGMPGRYWPVRGLASCDAKDLADEETLQKGMDVTPAITSGYINWDHLPGPENRIGVPTALEIVRIESHPILHKSGLTGLGLYAEGLLFPDNERAQKVWQMMETLEHLGDETGIKRSLAWSIQGRVLEKSGTTNVRTEIRQLAITDQPVLDVSFAEMAKSFSGMTTESAAPALLEQINGVVSLWGRCHQNCYDLHGRFAEGRKGVLKHLTECRGHSPEESQLALETALREMMH
jgi:hypothetical protein